MPRRMYALGSTHVPETAPESRNGSIRHPCLEAVWNQTLKANRLWYAPTKVGKLDGPPGTCFGLYALKYVVRGTECEGMDQRINHVASLDRFFTSPKVGVRRCSGCGPVRLLLLTNGVLLTTSENPEWHAQCIQAPDRGTFIVDAAAGEGHYAMCDSAGSLFTWGWNNEYGQLGQGNVFAADPARKGVHAPQRLPGFGGPANLELSKALGPNPPPTVFETQPYPNIVAVACGRHHTVALSESRCAVYTFGRGTCGQLGLGRPTAPGVQCSLRKVELLPAPRCVPCTFGSSVREIICVSDGASTILVLESGALVVWGDNTTGHFGLGSSKSVFVPTPVTLPPIDDNAPSDATVKSATVSRSAPYGTIESFLHPRRIKPLIPNEAEKKPPHTQVVLASASLSHSAIADGSGRLLTAGLRPLRVARNSLPVNALGALGRKLSSKTDALTFGQVEGIHVDDEDRIVCGDGFTCYLMRRQGLVFLLGTISVNGKILVGGGEEAHDMYCINTGVGRRVADIHAACDGGLFMVVDDA